MRTYIYTTSVSPAKYGRYVTLSVYRVKRNRPLFIGVVKFNTGSTKGEESEAYRVLMERGEVSRSSYSASGGYYRQSSEDIQIFGV